jgi:predicted small lipoprotein YifL
MTGRDARAALAIFVACALASCGQTGQLYLPDAASEVVTRPAQTPPPVPPGAPSSSQTVDSPQGPATPAPEVTAPVEKTEQDDAKKNGAAPAPKQ